MQWSERLAREGEGAILQGVQNIRENSLDLICEKIGNVTISFKIEKWYMKMMFQKDRVTFFG